MSGCSYQSISPACNAAAAVPASGIVAHSIRSMCASRAPAVKLGVPSRGVYPSKR